VPELLSYLPVPYPIAFAIGILALVLLIRAIRIVEEYERAVIFTLGKVTGEKSPGLYILIPLLQRAVVRDMRTKQSEIPRQEAITADSVAIKVSAVVWYKVVDATKSCVRIEHFDAAVVQLAQTNLRIIIGKNGLTEILKDQQTIAETMKTAIDKVTEEWGVAVSAVEMKNIEIPATMERSMAAEAEAQRDAAARLIKANAEFKASEMLAKAADIMGQHTGALELRRLQAMVEIGAEQNTMIIMPIPVEFMQMAGSVAKAIGAPKSEAVSAPTIAA
jgi:regulator of protease activity HflC (stomatin/prohibitin superfamily)